MTKKNKIIPDSKAKQFSAPMRNFIYVPVIKRPSLLESFLMLRVVKNLSLFLYSLFSQPVASSQKIELHRVNDDKIHKKRPHEKKAIEISPDHHLPIFHRKIL